MAWKLKKSKSTVDEMPDGSHDDESPNAQVSSAQYDRPGSSTSADSDYSDYAGSDRTVMLLNDSDYIPGLIPSAPPIQATPPTVSDSTDLFPVTSDEDLDRYLRGEHDFDATSLGGDSESIAAHDAVPVDHAVDLDEPVRQAIDFDTNRSHSEPIELDDLPISAPAAVVSATPPHAIDLDDFDSNPASPMPNGIHKPIDAPDDDSDFFASALNASDEAVASFRTAGEEKPPAAPVETAAPPSIPPDTHPIGSANMENWDLDAFAPYQPPGGGAARPAVEAAASAAIGGAVPAEETLSGALAVSRLVVRLGQFSASYELIKGETTIGRPDPRTSVFPDVAVEWDDAVSRNHCRVLHKSDGDYVEDTGSTNGTRLNDKPLAPYQPVLLSDGDRIGVGEKTDISYLK